MNVLILLLLLPRLAALPLLEPPARRVALDSAWAAFQRAQATDIVRGVRDSLEKPPGYCDSLAGFLGVPSAPARAAGAR